MTLKQNATEFAFAAEIINLFQQELLFVLFTNTDESKAFIRVCLYVCLCVFVRKIKPKWTKLQSPYLPHGQSIISPG